MSQRILWRPLPAITGHPSPHPNQPHGNTEDDQDGGQDSETVACDDATLLAMLSIQEAVRPPSLIVVGDIGDTEVEQQDEDQDRNTNPRVRGRSRKEDFQQGIEGVQTMHRDLQKTSH